MTLTERDSRRPCPLSRRRARGRMPRAVAAVLPAATGWRPIAHLVNAAATAVIRPRPAPGGTSMPTARPRTRPAPAALLSPTAPSPITSRRRPSPPAPPVATPTADRDDDPAGRRTSGIVFSTATSGVDSTTDSGTDGDISAPVTGPAGPARPVAEIGGELGPADAGGEYERDALGDVPIRGTRTAGAAVHRRLAQRDQRLDQRPQLVTDSPRRRGRRLRRHGRHPAPMAQRPAEPDGPPPQRLLRRPPRPLENFQDQGAAHVLHLRSSPLVVTSALTKADRRTSAGGLDPQLSESRARTVGPTPWVSLVGRVPTDPYEGRRRFHFWHRHPQRR
ncbi:hypothetical protein LY71_113134 [Geodermatophilus tzadiensis]|uniref:Uncharacterized protein n=1 Tax=Geodermatophilus tzadiensis TaxID=1137988 RepID=A0A2T0TPI8_9ACTN|nr:hypothetical protein LY71_113134 [Geodermatophilus tzadiensis]